MASDSEPQSLRAAFTEADHDRKQLEVTYSSTSDPDYQNALGKVIADFERCRSYVDQLALFSPNETLDDVATGDIQYLLVDFYLAELVQRKTGGERKANLLSVRSLHEGFLSQLDSYELLSAADKKLYERYQAAPSKFSTASITDAAARRETKIARFRAEKALKEKLQFLQNSTNAINADESTLRELYLTQLAFSVQQTFSALENIALELEVLSHAPPPDATPSEDVRASQRNGDGYSDRVDPPLAQLYRNGKVGPILSPSGRPLQPFTLLDSRQRLQDGVFRSGHNLPTMTIDEYLEEERRRGGIIEGGGPQSGLQPEPDEDNVEKADEETYKARAWDEFTEANPKGAGNTLNRG